jgi:hypothetical protein
LWRKEKIPVFRVKTYPSLLLVLMGSMDLFTTIIGILYFGAVECNPVLAGLVSTNLPVFAVLKLTTTIFVGFIFYQAKKILMHSNDKTSKSFKRTSYLLNAAYIGIVAFLVIVVVNNFLVLANIV